MEDIGSIAAQTVEYTAFSPASQRQSLLEVDEARFEVHRPAVFLIPVAAAVLGILSDFLFRVDRLGINMAVWTAALLLANAVLSRGRAWPLLRICFGASAFAFAACVAWHDSYALVALNVCGLLLSLALAASSAAPVVRFKAAVLQPALSAVQLAANTVRGAAALVFREIEWEKLKALLGGRAWALMRAAMISAPLLLIFGTLFCLADASFEELARNTIAWIPTVSPADIICICFVAWASAGVLRQFAYVRPAWIEPEGGANVKRDGSLELSITLFLLNALFLAFVMTQLHYFFGGMQHVLATKNLTLAQYARRGFFELVMVAALVLPMLLTFDWYASGLTGSRKQLFRVLAFALVAQLFLIMASAMHRMWLYRAAYGLTELRYFVTAFMLMLAIIFVWFCVTVLLGRRSQFVAGAVVIGMASAFALQATNPDARIAATNLCGLKPGAAVDLDYLVSLGADAVPVLVQAMPQMQAGMRAQVKQKVVDRKTDYSNRDWRDWSVARYRASSVLKELGEE